MATGSLELDQVLERVAEEMVRAVGVPYCGIYLIDSDGKRLMPQTAVNRSVESRCIALRALDPARDGLFKEALERKEPAICNDVGSDPRISPETARALESRSILAVPLKTGDRVLGVAVVSSFESYHAFVQEEVDLA